MVSTSKLREEKPGDGAATGSALKEEAQAAMTLLGRLQQHVARLGEATVLPVLDAVRDGRERLGRTHINVCVIGEQKSGKSTFLNAVLDAEVLSAAVRECTATVTFIRFDERVGYTAKLVSGETESFENVFRDMDPQFAQELSATGLKLAEFASNREAFPGEIQRLETSIPQLRADWSGREETLRQKETVERDARDVYGKAISAAESFAAELKSGEKEVPYWFRAKGTWINPVRAIGRFAMKKFTKPQWDEHYGKVLKLEEDRKQVQSLQAALSAAIGATEAERNAIRNLKELIRMNEERLAFLRQYLGDAPALAERLEGEHQSITIARETHRAEKISALAQKVTELTDMRGRGAEVAELEITYPSPFLPPGIVIIDTPGVNTANEGHRERAWQVIRRDADACLVLSDIQQTVSESTREFIGAVREVVPHIMLVLTKLDRALESADPDASEAEAQVAEAIQVGSSRFASTVGRSEDEILAFAVAAKPALRRESPEATSRFKAELERLFAAVVAERAIAVGSRCATALQRVYRETTGVVEQAESKARERVAMLEAQNILNPTEFCRLQIHALQGNINAAASEAANVMRSLVSRRFTSLENELVDKVLACAKPNALKEAADEIHNRSQSAVQAIIQECSAATDAAMGKHMQNLVTELRTDLRRRYQIGQSLAEATPREMPSYRLSPSSYIQIEEIGQRVMKNVDGFVSTQRSIGYGGALTGRELATGHPIAALLVLGFTAIRAATAKSFQTVRRDCANEVGKIVGDARDACLAASQANLVGKNLAAGLAGILQADLKEFKAWIEAVIAKERQDLARESSDLADLSDIRRNLGQCDTRLSTLLAAAVADSRGLSHSADPAPIGPT
jgi:GTP-binding protein EngB required for normal cell division